MDNPRKLTTPTVQLLGSLAVIGVALALTLLAAAMLGGPLEDAVARAAEAERRAWIIAALGGSADAVDPSAIAEKVDPVLFATTLPVAVYAPQSGPHAGLRALRMTTPDGYNGAIEFAMGIDAGGRILRVTVLAHEETRGFGAKIVAAGAPWLATFSGRSLEAPPADAWRLTASGGAIDGVSGATVTADAMITAMGRGLRFLARPVRDENADGSLP